MLRLHGADGHMADRPRGIGPPGQDLAVEVGDDQLQRRVGQELGVRDAAEQVDPVLRQAALEHLGQLGMRLDVHLVDHRAEDTHVVSGEQRVVQHDLVDRPPDASLATR